MKNICVLLYFFLIAIGVQAQNAGDIDPTFQTEEWFGRTAGIDKVVVQPDGKIVVSGNISFYHTAAVNNIVRLNEDGTLDTTFNPGALFSAINSFAVQPDGKIIVCGYIAGVCSLARLNTDGTIDPSFNCGTGFTLNSGFGRIIIELQPDGKVIAGGGFSTYNGSSVYEVVRINTDGTLDASYHSELLLSYVNDLKIQSDGKVIVCGQQLSGPVISAVFRLNNDGTVDNTFNPTTLIAGDSIYRIAFQPDGKIILAGYFDNILFPLANLIRLNGTGTFDAVFGITDNNINALAVQADGKILIGGLFKTYNNIAKNGIVRIDSNGTIDTTFNDGLGCDGDISCFATQPDNKILVAGNFKHYDTTATESLVRVDSNGVIDAGFATGNIIVKSYLYSAINQPDGKVLVGARFEHYGESYAYGLIRFNADGGVDNTFNTGSGFNDSVRDIIIQTDGKILVATDATSYNGAPIRSILRLNIDGSIDATFNNSDIAFFSLWINKIALQPDGKIIAIGYDGFDSNNIVRYNADGSIDSSFGSATGFDDEPMTLLIQPDGKIIVGGYFTTYNGTTSNNIIRLNDDGTIDISFNTGTGIDLNNGYVASLILQPDNKILVGGVFSYYNDIPIHDLVRLNSDGSIDSSFSGGGTGFSRYPRDMKLQADGKIVACGNFTSYNGTTTGRIARLNSDGSLDTSFITGSGFDSLPWNLDIQPDGNIIVAGTFNAYNGSEAKQIIRLKGTGAMAVNEPTKQPFSLYPNPVKDKLTLMVDATTTIESYEIYDMVGKLVESEETTQNQIDIKTLSKGVYILKIHTNQGQLTNKFIKE